MTSEKENIFQKNYNIYLGNCIKLELKNIFLATINKHEHVSLN